MRKKRVAPWSATFYGLVMTYIDEDARALRAAARHAEAYLSGLGHRRVAASVDVGDLRRRMAVELQDDGLPVEAAVEAFVENASPGLVASASGRFFGWVVGGTLPAAVAADWLTAAWDQNAALYACSPAAAIAEEVAGAWLKDLLVLPRGSSFAFVTGCQMAHVTCLAAARRAVLRQTTSCDPEVQGLSGLPRIRILVGAQRHASIERAVGLLGLGRANIAPLPVDGLGRIRREPFEAALSANRSAPTIVVMQAGDIATGSFDDFKGLIPIAKRFGAWVHIDGAFGLWARASERYSQLAAGCELADSWATDGHKVLNTPFDCGYAFVARSQDHRAAFSLRASYLTHADDARDQIDWNPDWSRRARGFSTYAALLSLGRSGVSRLFEQYCHWTETLTGGITALPQAELVSKPIINQALVGFRDPRPDAAERDHDRLTDEIIRRINETGEAFFTGTTWNGRRAMRVSVCNWRTDADDVSRAIAAIASVLSSALSAPRAVHA